MIIIPDFPIAPTVNHAYVGIGKRRCKGPKYRQYELDVTKWRLQNEIEPARVLLQKYIDEGKWIQLDLYLAVKETTIISQLKKIKIWDCSNRIKILEDCFAKMIGIDDRYFILGRVEKVITKKEERAIMVLTPAPMRSDIEVLEEIDVKAREAGILCNKDSQTFGP